MSLWAFDSNRTLAADADPLGAWNLTVMLPDGGALNMILKLEKKDGELSGLLSAEDGSETEISDADFKNGELTFKLVRDFGGQELKSTFTGKVDQDEFNGTVDYELGGDGGTLDVTGTREKLVVLTGTWMLVASSEGGTFEPKLHLKHEADAVSGRYVWVDDSEIDIEEAKFEDGELKFTVRHDFGGQPLVVRFCIKPDGDSLSGTADYDLDGETGTATVEGAKAVNVAGTWSITISGPNGETFETTANIQQDGNDISGDYSGPAGDAKITDAELNGKTLTFSVVRDQGGQSVVMKYAGIVDGDAMSGEIDFDYNGEEYTLDFVAKRGQ